MVQSAYRSLALISFFTACEDEVKAWTIHQGEKAVDAAGEIHSDLARGFIRAEIVTWPDLEKSGSFEAAKSQGLMKLEMKDYVMRDGRHHGGPLQGVGIGVCMPEKQYPTLIHERVALARAGENPNASAAFDPGG